MLNYNHYLKELGIKSTDFPFEKSDDRYYPDKEGFVPAEFFNLDTTFSMYIYSHLSYFRDHCMYGCPGNMTFEQWEKIIDDMITAFRLLLTEEESYSIWDDEGKKQSKRRQRKINKGMRYFIKYYNHLWY